MTESEFLDNCLNEEEVYYPVYVCKNTHEQASSNNKFCTICGEEVIFSCISCSTLIKRGYIKKEPIECPEHLKIIGFEEIFYPFKNFEIPNYCSECGKPYPWTEKFFKDYKTILELQSEEIGKELQDKVFKATEEALKNKFTGSSLTILRLTLGRVSSTAKPFLIDVLSGVTVSKIIDILK